MQRVSEVKRVIFTFIYDYSYDKILQGKFIIIIRFDKKSKWNEQNEFRSLLYRILRKILKFHYNLINIKYFIFTIYHDRLLINFDKSIIHYCLWLDLQFIPDNDTIILRFNLWNYFSLSFNIEIPRRPWNYFFSKRGWKKNSKLNNLIN